MNLDPDKYQEWEAKRRAHLESLKAEKLFPKLIKGDRSALASAITLIESTQNEHRKEANSLIKRCLPYSGNAWRIGITGVPGVGKSTFIEAIGKRLIDEGHRLAVMAIDPSSSVSGGSILGDKTRMETLATLDHVFIRPTATGKTLGGVAQHTRETIILCEAAGFDVIFIETVGVGQSETVVHSMVDFFLLLMLAGAGDELQGIKRGIMEMADGILITKADQGNENQAKIAKKNYENALHLFKAKEGDWTPQVACISSLEGNSLHIPLKWWQSYFNRERRSSSIKRKRNLQDLAFFEEAFEYKLKTIINEHEGLNALYERLQTEVIQGEKSPYEAAEQLFAQLIKGNGKI